MNMCGHTDTHTHAGRNPLPYSRTDNEKGKINKNYVTRGLQPHSQKGNAGRLSCLSTKTPQTRKKTQPVALNGSFPQAFALSEEQGRRSFRGVVGGGAGGRNPHLSLHSPPPRGSFQERSGGAPQELVTDLGHGALTMELSEYVQKGFQMLADPGSFDSNAFTLLLRAAFQSLLDAQADEAVLDHPDLKHIDPVVLKHCHTAAATYILEAGKQRADKSTLSTYLEDCKFDRERIELFCTEYQNNKNSLEILLGSIGRSLPHITDVSWRLEYQIKTHQLHKMYRPAYLVTLNVENTDSRSHPEISFSCNMEQLQDLVGRLKDASKSLERATQL
uniref:COMM domain-containing protein 3 n=2 Tax=Felis catus TaxID=9685 RepID=A0ABI7YEE0_FELCA